MSSPNVTSELAVSDALLEARFRLNDAAVYIDTPTEPPVLVPTLVTSGPVKHTFENGVLEVVDGDTREFSHMMVRPTSGNETSFSFGNHTPRAATLHLPLGYVVTKHAIRLAHGSVEVAGITAGRISVEMGNGSIDIQDTTLLGSDEIVCDLQNTHGDTRLSFVRAAGKVTVENTHGGILIDTVEAAELEMNYYDGTEKEGRIIVQNTPEPKRTIRKFGDNFGVKSS